LGLGHSCHADRLIILDPLCVAERGTASNVDDHEDDEHDNVQDGDLAPALLDAGKDACLARVALEAKHLLVVAPLGTVCFSQGNAGVLCPIRFVPICERTRRWWLTASRLKYSVTKKTVLVWPYAVLQIPDVLFHYLKNSIRIKRNHMVDLSVSLGDRELSHLNQDTSFAI
jgi:hypothetical protein